MVVPCVCWWLTLGVRGTGYHVCAAGVGRLSGKQVSCVCRKEAAIRQRVGT